MPIRSSPLRVEGIEPTHNAAEHAIRPRDLLRVDEPRLQEVLEPRVPAVQPPLGAVLDELLVLREVDLACGRVGALAPDERAEDVLDPDLLRQVLVDVDEVVLVELRHRHVHRHLEAREVTLELVQSLDGGDDVVEEAFHEPVLVVLLADVVDRDREAEPARAVLRHPHERHRQLGRIRPEER